MTKSILIAIDLTADASWKHALPKAVELARFYKAELHVTYVLPADVTVKLHLRHGEVHDEVLSVIGESGADLVIMASHAPDNVREFLVGSQADRLVRRSPVSVLVVRSQS